MIISISSGISHKLNAELRTKEDLKRAKRLNIKNNPNKQWEEGNTDPTEVYENNRYEPQTETQNQDIESITDWR